MFNYIMTIFVPILHFWRLLNSFYIIISLDAVCLDHTSVTYTGHERFFKVNYSFKYLCVFPCKKRFDSEFDIDINRGCIPKVRKKYLLLNLKVRSL